MPRTSPADVRQHAQETLRGLPQKIAENYIEFAETGNLTRLDEVVLGVLEFYLATPPPQPLIELTGSTRIVQDLGCDSLTMLDMVFLALVFLLVRPEGLFGEKIIDRV